MIGYAHDLLVEHVVAPQADEARGETQVYLDPAAMPMDVAPQEIDVTDRTTRPIGYEIGGGVELRHMIDVAVDVRHADAGESRRLRDLILTELVLRFYSSGRAAMGGQYDAATRQTVTVADVLIDYTRPMRVTTTSETATLTFTVDTTVDG